jgi:glycosyltransferase involved in cell wall biosynthesis
MMEQINVAVAKQWENRGLHSDLVSTRYTEPSRSDSQPPRHSTASRLRGRRVAMVTFYPYPVEPRTRRAVGALLQEGMSVDLICIAEGDLPARETLDGLNIFRFPLSHRRDSKLAYVYNYLAFIFISGSILALRSLKRRYDLVYVHNMPDILVLSALVPKLLGAKVLLDIRDPMPELMTTIFNLDKESVGVRLMQRLEKWSMALAHTVVTVNAACERIFASRSCPPSKIGVVMNSPDEQIFPFRSPRSYPAVRGVPSKHFVIMYHGSLVERNGVDLAVEALARVRQAVPVAELRIYGFKTPFLEKVMDAARDKGLQESVHYLGPRSLEELVGEIEDCDVGIISNQRNAFTEINTPTRIFEYLTMGKPVIAPRTPGIQDYFPPGSLVFFESGNTQELADKLRDVAFDYDEAVVCAERGQRVYLNHAWSRERLILVNLVDRLLRGKKGTVISEDQIQHECGYK